jgi:tetratricopeptide (TPR) repeat protein
MNFFSRLFGKAKPPPDPETLRQQLFNSAHDRRALERLCRTHRDLVRQHFDGWRKVPVEVRGKPELMQWYMQGMVGVAEVFQGRFGDPALMQLLTGPPGTNPLERWKKCLDDARKLKAELRYAEAVTLLGDQLIDARGLKGSGVDAYLPVTLGELGECYLQIGEAAKAVAPTRQALDLVEHAGDAEGVFAYLGNLYEVHRYLDQPVEAAGYADRLAEHLERQGQHAESRRYRRQAQLVRAGEPRNRVVAEINGARYELDELLEGIEGGVRFHFDRNKMTLRPAEVLTQRGEQLGSQGRYDEALALFRDAARADPLAPHPPYQAAGALMDLGRAAEAIDEYARTEELAPGWFHCRSEMWLAQQIVVARYDVRAYQLLRAVEDGRLNAQARRQLAEQGLAQYPDLALLHQLHGLALRDLGQNAQAVAAWRRGLTCAEEPDVRTRLLADIAGLLDPGDERRRLLDEALTVNGNLVAAATARILLQFG